MEFLSNPFEHEYFVPTLIRLAIILIVGALGISIASIKSPAKLTKELWLRYFSWVIISPLFLSSIYCGAIPAVAVFLFVSFRAIKEYISVSDLPKPYAIALYLFIPISLLCVKLGQITILPVVYLSVTTIITLQRNNPKDLARLLTTLLGAHWILYLFLHATLLLQRPEGALLFTLTGFSVALCDIGNFTMGKMFYKMKLGTEAVVAHNISKEKTYAGYLGGIIGVGLTITLFLPMVTVLPLPQLLIFLCLIPFCAAVGDLSESLFKRYFVVKDSSNFIPGHGGVLDRLDSFLPSVAAVYYLSLLF